MGDYLPMKLACLNSSYRDASDGEMALEWMTWTARSQVSKEPTQGREEDHRVLA